MDLSASIERTCYVTNLHEKVTEPILEEMFIQMGPLEKVLIRSNPPTGGPGAFRYALVIFKDPESVLFASQCLDNIRLHGMEISVRPKGGSMQEKKYKEMKERALHFRHAGSSYSQPYETPLYQAFSPFARSMSERAERSQNSSSDRSHRQRSSLGQGRHSDDYRRHYSAYDREGHCESNSHRSGHLDHRRRSDVADRPSVQSEYQQQTRNELAQANANMSASTQQRGMQQVVPNFVQAVLDPIRASLFSALAGYGSGFSAAASPIFHGTQPRSSQNGMRHGWTRNGGLPHHHRF